MGMRPQGNEQEARRNKHVRSAPSKIAVKALGEEVLDGILDKSPNPLLLILDCVQDPHNLGAILRTADALDIPVTLLEGCADPYGPKTVRASMGAVFRTQPVKADWAARFRRRCGKGAFYSGDQSGAHHEAAPEPRHLDIRHVGQRRPRPV